ncbi:MAG: Crp/Fnr family transcriptional regulator [Bacteroidales bacterium]|nr:Crp/Fnr family transcriptional regulator [Bacteroidales bacterium]
MNSNDLFSCPICRNIPEQERAAFLEQLDYKIKYYKKGEFVAHQEDAVNALYLLLKGSVKTEMISDAGAVLKIETIKAPSPLAPAFLFAENNRFPVDVIALEECEAILILKSSIMKLLASNEAFLQGFMAFNSNRTNFLSERIKLFSIKTIKGKLSQYILSRAKNLHFTLDMPQTQLAEYFGVARPSLARSLSELIEEKVITLEKRQGVILNLNVLKEFISQ